MVSCAMVVVRANPVMNFRLPFMTAISEHQLLNRRVDIPGRVFRPNAFL